jgi:archaeal type IV pilus assembly protein PilA
MVMQTMEKSNPEHHETAVSPVVGVMLMLVVVIIIAAVVSAFAGGLATKDQKAPVSVLDVRIHALENAGGMPPWGNGYYAPTLTIQHVSGDTLPTKDLRILTYYKNQSGSTLRGNLSGEIAVAGNDTWTYYAADQYCGVLFINDPKRFGTGAVQNSNSGRSNWFGNASAVLQTGDILTTPAQFCGNYDDNTGPTQPHKNTGMNYLLGFDATNSIHGFRTGSVVNVKIVHLPSGKAIFDKDVVVE